MLTNEEVWLRPNESSNSIGNLILHLCGNVRQWILSGLGKLPDRRIRQSEFDERGPIPHVELMNQLKVLKEEVEVVLGNLKPEDLIAQHSVQGFEENGVSIVVHVIEHFSYHTGQITYQVKAIKNVDTGYYSGLNLDTTS